VDHDLNFDTRRTRAGIPQIRHKRRGVVAADAIALLSGVNFASVVKVLAAIDAVRNFSEEYVEDIVDLQSIPLERADPARDIDAERAQATREFCEDLVKADVHDEEAEAILNLKNRFGAKVART
jgi:hypothetical protein